MPVAIIGGGPIGLASLAHCMTRDLKPILFEKETHVGGTFQQTPHVNLFSQWRYSVDGDVLKWLRTNDSWVAPNSDIEPTGKEFVAQYLKPFSELPKVKACIHLQTEVLSVSRKGCHKCVSYGRAEAPFVVRTVENGKIHEYEVDAVIDASGVSKSPNPIGINGLPVPGEKELGNKIQYGMPDILTHGQERYRGKRVVVLGSGHSAMENMLSLVKLNEKHKEPPIWAIRGADTFKNPLDDVIKRKFPALIKLLDRVDDMIASDKIRMVPHFRVKELVHGSDGKITVVPDSKSVASITGVDEIIVSNGSKPDHSITRELRIQLDAVFECPYNLAPVIDPELFTCNSVKPNGYKELGHPEANFYIVGRKSYGRAPRLLLETGHRQISSVIAMVAGDKEAADRIYSQESAVIGPCSSVPFLVKQAADKKAAEENLHKIVMNGVA